MAKNDRGMLILFLKVFRKEILATAGALKTKTLNRNTIENVFAFKIASVEEKNVIHQMVGELESIKDTQSDTGQLALVSGANADQVSEITDGAEKGKARTYAKSQYHGNDEAA